MRQFSRVPENLRLSQWYVLFLSRDQTLRAFANVKWTAADPFDKQTNKSPLITEKHLAQIFI